MDEREAREVKAQMVDYTRQLSERLVRPSDVAQSGPALALGLARRPDGSYQLAVRYRLGLSSVRSVARKVVDKIGEPDTDVRRTGRIRGLSDESAVRPRPPVIRARSLGETGRARPLRPGVSIAHVDVSAGTLGAFVHVDGEVHALSNYHVLSGSPQAQVGDVVVQPGPADGGQAPRDRVGTLAARVELEPNRSALVDCAIARLDPEFADADLQYPVGRVTTTAVALGAEVVGKLGRTTAATHGRVSAIELDDVVVGYGDELGELSLRQPDRGRVHRGTDRSRAVAIPGRSCTARTAWRSGCSLPVPSLGVTMGPD